jgi:hypothetical protein
MRPWAILLHCIAVLACALFEVDPVELPLRLDDAGASPTTPQRRQQQNLVYF